MTTTDAKTPYGPKSETDYTDPGYQHDKVARYPLDSAEHCRAAWSYINMPKNAMMYSPQHLAAVKARIRAAAEKFGITIADDEDSSKRSADLNQFDEMPPRAPIEIRQAAAVQSVDFAKRLITVIAVPYEEPALVEYRGEVWSEIMERTAFMGIEKRPNRVRANRDHNKTRTFGKVVRFWPDAEPGLVAEVRAAQTPLGEETLILADEECLGASVGFGVPPACQQLDRSTMTRRIKTAYLDHLAFVESPAYEGAKVLSVRETPDLPAPSTPLITPNLDDAMNDDLLRWMTERLNK